MHIKLLVVVDLIGVAAAAGRPEPVYSCWNEGDNSHSFHLDGPWAGEKCTLAGYYAWRDGQQPDGATSVQCHWNAENKDHSCHVGGPYDGETEGGIVFWALPGSGPFTQPICVCWNDGAKDHTTHACDETWSGESCNLSPDFHAAKPSWPESITYSLLNIYSGTGGSSGTIKETRSWTKGIEYESSSSKATSKSVAGEVQASAGISAGLWSASVSASVSTSIDTEISSSWSAAQSESMEVSYEFEIHFDQPAYIYRAQIQINMNDGTVVTNSGSYYQDTSPISPPYQHVELDVFKISAYAANSSITV